LILNDWTHQLYFSLHVNYQSHDYSRQIAEDIRGASPWRYAEHSFVENVTSGVYELQAVSQ